MSPQWIGPAVAVFVALCGLAANLIIIGRFVGQWGEQMKNIAATLQKVELRVEDVEERAESTEAKRALMDARLESVETGVDRFWAMRDEFVTMRTTVARATTT